MALGSPTMVTPPRDTINVLAAGQIIQMDDRVYLLDPDKAPFALLAAMLNRQAVHNPEYKCLEDFHIPEIVNVSAGIAGGATAVVLASGEGAYITVNMILKHQASGELVLATAIATDTITITRSIGSTAAATWATGDDLTVLGGAAAEGAIHEAALSTKKEEKTNFTQIFRRTTDITNTEVSTLEYGGETPLAYQHKKLGIDFARHVDLAFMFGEKTDAALTSPPRRTTGGLDEYVDTNRTDMGGSFSLTSWIDFMATLSRYGSGKIVGLVSRGFYANVTKEALNFLEMGSSEKILGMDITTLRTPLGGDVKLIPHNSLRGQHYGGYGLFFDPTRVGYRYLAANGENRDTKMSMQIQANSADRRTDEMLGEIGFFRANEATHGVVTGAGVTTAF